MRRSPRRRPARACARRTKAELEELQAAIRLKTGEKVTQQEVLSRLVQSAIESRTEFVDSFGDWTFPLTDEEVERFDGGMISSGVETDEGDIDDILYG